MKGLDYIKAPDMPPEYVAYVSPNFHYDSYKQTFPTIQEAIDYMYGRYGWVFGMTINVYPGTYNEQIHSFPIFFIKGIVHNKPSSEQRVATLYNTGADPDHYPLRANDGDGYMIHNMNIKTDYGGTFGRLGNDRYVSCNFSGGSFIESTQNVSIFESWADCSFVNCAAFNVTGVAPQGRYLVFEDCWFGWWQTMRFESTHTAGNAVFDIDGGHLAFTKLSLKGDWYHFAKNYHSFGAYRTDYDTTKGIVYRNVTISNGIHFFSNPMSFKMIGCEMEDAAEMPIPDGEADITADVAITDVNFQNNSMHNGLSGEIEIQGKIRSVGGNEINKYISIQDAIDSLTSDGIIFLQPGTYTEQIHSRSEILIQGRTHEGVPAVKSTILYNTGVDSDHYPLGDNGSSVFNISDITIKTDPDEVIGKLSPSNFTGVVFQNGYFIEATTNQDMLMGLSDCSFEDTMAFNLTGVGSGGLRAMTIVGCYFNDYATHWVMDSTHDATLVIVKNSIFHQFYPDTGGNWNVEVSNSHCFGTDRSVISTTNKISYIQCIISNGLHFTSDPDTIIQLCTFNDGCGYSITGADVTASVTVTDVNYVNNVQQNGISGNIQIQCPVKPVGCDSSNKYYTLQDALTSIPDNGAGTVKISETFTGLSELVIPTGVDVNFDAQKIYSLTFTGDIVEVGTNQKCLFQNFVQLNGSDMFVNGTGAELKFSGCGVINGHITITDGNDVKIQRSGLVADAGFPAVTMNDLTCAFTFGYSKLQGATGYPAILTTAECDGMIKGKFSTLISGTPLTISPLLYTGLNKLDISLYNSALSGTFNAATFSNLISSPNLTYDSGINY